MTFILYIELTALSEKYLGWKYLDRTLKEIWHLKKLTSSSLKSLQGSRLYMSYLKLRVKYIGLILAIYFQMEWDQSMPPNCLFLFTNCNGCLGD